MPVTRRQASKRVAAPPQDADADGLQSESDLTDLESVMSNREDDEPSDADVGNLELEGNDSDGSSYSTSPRREKPAKKKAKTLDNSSPKKKVMKAKKPKKSLSILPTMPLDILFEILGCLDPTDLLSLARTSKSFRDLLMTRKSILVWKNARIVANGPDCPDDFSEPQWASLLYGPKHCQHCGTKPVLKIEFYLRRRVCTRCLKKHLVRPLKFAEAFEEYDPLIMDLIPYTNVGGWAHGYPSHTKFFWDEDIVDMGQKLGQYQKAVHMRRPGAKQALQDFIEKCKTRVETIVNSAPKYVTWVQDDFWRRRQDMNTIRQKRQEDIIARLLLLGYDQVDIDFVRSRDRLAVGQFRIAKLITVQSWPRILRIIEPRVEASKQRRREEELRVLHNGRKVIVNDLYNAFQQGMPTRQRLFLPAQHVVHDFPRFREHIEAPQDTQITAAHFDEAMSALPETVEAWENSQKAVVDSLLPPKDAPASETSVAHVPQRCLATSVFRCPHRGLTLIGYEDAVMYRQCELRELQFNPRGQQAVLALLETMGLDKATTTPADLDALNARYQCNVCLGIQHPKFDGNEARNWRQCVDHFLTQDLDHAVASWKEINADDTARIKRMEPYSRMWMCNHCDLHIITAWAVAASGPQKKSDAIEHIKQRHDVQEPAEGRDYFWDPRLVHIWTYTPPYKL